MAKKAAKRLYFLVELKRAKVSPKELVQFYVACIPSVLLCARQVFHASLPQYLSLTIERTQKRALSRILFGYEVHYHDALSRSGLVTLEQRRTELCKKRFDKIVANPSNILHLLIPFNEECCTDILPS